MSAFEDMLAVLGITEEQINANNAEYSPAEFNMAGRANVGPSEIHGKGLFADISLEQGENILPVVIDGGLTRGGAHINHSDTPSCVLLRYPGGDMDLLAERRIQPGEELTTDYRHARWLSRKELRI